MLISNFQRMIVNGPNMKDNFGSVTDDDIHIRIMKTLIDLKGWETKYDHTKSFTNFSEIQKATLVS